MNKCFNCVLGLISIILLSILNVVLTLPVFTVVLFDQIRVGVGTALEMGAIIIWTLEILCLGPFLTAVFFTVVSIFKKDYYHKIIINIVQIVLYITLNILANVWLFL